MMKRYLIALASLAILVGCGGNEIQTQPGSSAMAANVGSRAATSDFHDYSKSFNVKAHAAFKVAVHCSSEYPDTVGGGYSTGSESGVIVSTSDTNGLRGAAGSWNVAGYNDGDATTVGVDAICSSL
jgi:hypothetical protein